VKIALYMMYGKQHKMGAEEEKKREK
jgi:hypothetical protein